MKKKNPKSSFKNPYNVLPRYCSIKYEKKNAGSVTGKISFPILSRIINASHLVFNAILSFTCFSITFKNIFTNSC